jgi:nucleotide-binding universal stress UspA family protein
VLLHVVPPTSYPLRNLGSISGFPNLHDEIHKRVTQELREVQEAIQTVPTEAHIAEGEPHNQILEAAAQHDCELIVMSTHGHTGLKHAILGSTAERVVRLSDRPVLTLRAPDDAS